MLEDFDYMVNVLRDTMPHDLAIHDVHFGVSSRIIVHILPVMRV